MQRTTPPGFLSFQPLATLGKLTAAALVASALSFALLALTILLAAGTIIQPLVFVAVALLIVASVVATGIRWTPLLGALTGLGTMVGGVFTQQYFVYHLTHPAEGGPFFLCLLICTFSFIAIWVGISATIQNYHSTARSAPRWLPAFLAALGGFVLGAMLIALLVQTAPATTASAPVGGEPAVHMGVSTFVQSSVTVSKGSKLKLIDDGAFLHVLSNGQWENNQPHPTIEAGAPTVQNVQVNGNTVEIGPFNTAGTFHLYCTVHPGMNLTIIVQ